MRVTILILKIRKRMLEARARLGLRVEWKAESYLSCLQHHGATVVNTNKGAMKPVLDPSFKMVSHPR